jgi:hypothetical protein
MFLKLLTYISTSFNRFQRSFPVVTLEIEQNKKKPSLRITKAITMFFIDQNKQMMVKKSRYIIDRLLL